MAVIKPDMTVAIRGRIPPWHGVASPTVSNLTGRLVAARRNSLGLSQSRLAEDLHQAAGEEDDLQSIIRWIQRLESGDIYQPRTAPTRQRYMNLLEILGFDRDEPAIDVLTTEISELREGLDTLRTLMLRMLERVDGSK